MSTLTVESFTMLILSTVPTLIPENRNKVHIKSHGITIRNLLLIRQNQQFDSLMVKESERLVRSMGFIRDVSFFVKSASKGSDSVDINIRALDIWSIIPNFSTSTSRTSIGLTDQNFLGFGHEFQNEITRNYTKGNYAFHTNYSIPNIRNTYVSTTLDYAIDGDRYFSKSLNIDRPFFSPFFLTGTGAIGLKNNRYMNRVKLFPSE